MHNNKPINEQISPERRQFLRGVAAASAVGLVATAGSAMADAPAPATVLPEAEQGYHETDHIRAYYASCR
ncbi:MAG: twin-arginine translocation pathway signal [Nitrincola lacisaponensis]|uniref:Formate dehydrogenase subunit or accessory protein n=1 Tax=Nitrincola lacisaponensis TaxID=267850 RepID=A0A063Y050_9GAMM|nr:formate dehydrogenase [Nitrincola lacisaponensis]KDE39074.1 hypothetical protein ADINL_2203 [Nitrincola lacisaponensis]